MPGIGIQAVTDLRRSIESLITITSPESASTTLSNGEFATFTITTTGTSGGVTMVIHDFTLYLGSVSAAHALPDGSSIDMSQWQVVAFPNDWGATNNINTVTKVYVRNISAGASQTVAIHVQARMLQNSVTLGGTSA